MNRLVTIGLILIVLGLAGLIVPRIGFTDSETVIDAGPVQVQAERERSIEIPDVAGGAAIAAGLVLVVVGSRRKGGRTSGPGGSAGRG
ncbi:MAG: hypothetical protein WD336_07555 [Trueperaceae bacterium]